MGENSLESAWRRRTGGVRASATGRQALRHGCIRRSRGRGRGDYAFGLPIPCSRVQSVAVTATESRN